MNPNTIDNLADIMSPGEVIEYWTRWSYAPLIGWNIVAVPAYLIGVANYTDHETWLIGFWWIAGATLVSLISFMLWYMRKVVVTNERVIYISGLDKQYEATPVEKIEHIKVTQGGVQIGAGANKTAMKLTVPNAPSLALAIEDSRKNFSSFSDSKAADCSPKKGLEKPSNKSLSSRDIVLGSIVWGILLLGVMTWWLTGETSNEYAASRPSVPRPTTINEPVSYATVQAEVPDSIQTEFLMDCWMTAIRGAYGWIPNKSRTDDSLNHLYGRGGIVVFVEVTANRINIDDLRLVGVTGHETVSLTQSDRPVQPRHRNYYDAQSIYTTAVRAITRCGIADNVLPNGKYHFIFDPSRDDIPVIPQSD